MQVGGSRGNHSCDAIEHTTEDTRGNESSEPEQTVSHQDQAQTAGEQWKDTNPVADHKTHTKDTNGEAETSVEDVHQDTARESDRATDVPTDATGTADEPLEHANVPAESEDPNARYNHEAREKQPGDFKDAATSPEHPTIHLSSDKQLAQSQPSNALLDRECSNGKDAACHDNSSNMMHAHCADQRTVQQLQQTVAQLQRKLEVCMLSQEKSTAGTSEGKPGCPCLSAPGTSHHAHNMPRGLSPQASLPDANTLEHSRARSPRPQQGLVWIIPEVMYNDDRLKTPLHQLAALIDKQLEIRPLPSSSITMQHVGNVILPVIAASRVGSDLQAAVQKAKLKVPAVVLIYNHLAPHMSRIRTPTKERLSDRQLADSCQDMVDLVFWNGNMYDCDTNTMAVRQLKQLLPVKDNIYHTV